jgi:2-amino-4-hydroxy-6-hydroxymethyldihydropteridine diphosphokinase
MSRVWLGLGTNLGDRETNLTSALAALRGLGTIEAVSTVYESEPVGFREQPNFWNLALRLHTDLDPEALLGVVKAIEHDLGRRPTFPNAPRPIDIDLLLYDQELVAAPNLTIPHPRLTERAFVLRPLVELDPELRHPRTGKLLQEYLQEKELEETVALFPSARLLE